MEPTTQTTQLKTDLSSILSEIKRDSELSDPVKRHLGELVAWCEAHVDHSKDLDDRLETSEAAIEELINGGGELLEPETAAKITAGIEHALLLCQAISALLDGPFASVLDGKTQKRLKQLVEITFAANSLSNQIVADLVAEPADEEEDEENDDDGLGTDDGSGDDGAVAEDEEEVDADE